MWIDKTAAYYTEQDRTALAEYEDQRGFWAGEIASIANQINEAKKAGDEVLASGLREGLSEVLNKEAEVEEAREKLEQTIEQRYIDAFSGNTAAILEDVKEIVEAVEREDFLSWHMKTAPAFKALAEEKPANGSSRKEKDRYKAIKQLTVRGYSACYYFILRHVRAQLNALAFYKKIGFKQEGIQEQGYYYNNEYSDFVMMRLLRSEWE